MGHNSRPLLTHIGVASSECCGLARACRAIERPPPQFLSHFSPLGFFLL